MKRPLAVCAIALIGGILLSDVSISQVWTILCLLLVLFFMILAYRPVAKTASRFVLLAIPFFLAGYTLHSVNRSHHTEVLKTWYEQNVTVVGTVAKQPEFFEGKTRFVLIIKHINAQVKAAPLNANLRVTLYTEEPIPGLKYGSIISLRGEIRQPPGKRNIGGFDTQKYLAAHEISGIMSEPANALTLLEGNESSWILRAGYTIRDSILGALNKCLPPKEASVVSGMLLGYTAEMPEEMEEDFRRAGLSHVMAVSGANIAFILMPLLWILQHLGFNRRWASLLSFPLMLFYVFATGMEASVIRAAVMAGVMLVGMILWRKTDIFCSMAVSTILILLFNSYRLFDPGFILSFLATLSLAVFYKPFFDKLPVKWPKGIRNALAGTLAAQIGVIPVIAYNFNTFSVVSVFSNLLIVPLTGLITVLGALVAVFGNVAVPAGLLLGKLTALLVDGMLFITSSIAKLPWAEIHLATPSLFLVGLYYLVLLYFRYGRSRFPKDTARRLSAGIGVLCGTLVILLSLPDYSLRIYFTDVGQGDCILIRTPRNRNIVIDGGGSITDVKDSYIGENTVVPLLYDLNMTHIDLMIATHGHADHISGLGSIIDTVPVKDLMIADAPDIEMKGLIEHAEKMGIPVEKVKEGEVLFKEDGMTLISVYPFSDRTKMPESATTSANEYSLVTRLDYGEFNALFTGDIGAETEKLLVEERSLLDCDLIKIAHHGSKYSSEQSFISAANPSLAIISVGQNRYGHPSPDVINRLHNQGIKVFTTLDQGGILVRIKPGENKMLISTTVSCPP